MAVCSISSLMYGYVLSLVNCSVLYMAANSILPLTNCSVLA